MTTIRAILSHDLRFRLKPGEGADAVHTDPVYSYAVTQIKTDASTRPISGDAASSGEDATAGIGLALTLGAGNGLVCGAIDLLAAQLIGREVEEMMAGFGLEMRRLANHPQIRWLGPHKGVVHLALASIVNACFDLWAKSRGEPLWRLLLSLSPEQIVSLLDFSYLDEILTADEAREMLKREAVSRPDREPILKTGYPGYDTSVGWFHYDDDAVGENARRAADLGFSAMKLKVGSTEPDRDIRRASLVRDAVGPDVRVMLDANQQWSLPQALDICQKLAGMSPYWIEEPTHPDDVIAHRTLSRIIAPIPIAVGEHIPNVVLFKNFLQAGAVQIVQVDCTRVAGVSEFLTISLLARKFGAPVAPHVGDMGQIHQHLVLFNHIAMGHPALFLEYIPHLRERFCHPAAVSEGVYQTPETPGSSCDFVGDWLSG